MNKAIARPTDIKPVRVLKPYVTFEGKRRFHIRVEHKLPVNVR